MMRRMVIVMDLIVVRRIHSDHLLGGSTLAWTNQVNHRTTYNHVYSAADIIAGSWT
jgi:hypothetical protein